MTEGGPPGDRTQNPRIKRAPTHAYDASTCTDTAESALRTPGFLAFLGSVIPEFIPPMVGPLPR